MRGFDEYARYKEFIDEHIFDFLPEADPESAVLRESMAYSLKGGGKRVRPVLLLAACEFAGGDLKQALPYACAVEYIHTYSLIHDDLPAMDDDGFRRGLPSNHAVFGEAVAILSGDGLLSLAFEIMNRDILLCSDDPAALWQRARAAYEISKCAGCRGMVAGQTADIESENKSVSGEFLDYIHLNKTAALIVGAVKAGAYMGKADRDMITNLENYAKNLGLAFQVADDILDVSGEADEIGKKSADMSKRKAAYPAVHGMERSRRRLKELTDDAVNFLKPYYGEAEFFVRVAGSLAKRSK